jgi:hypothetical protein
MGVVRGRVQDIVIKSRLAGRGDCIISYMIGEDDGRKSCVITSFVLERRHL